MTLASRIAEIDRTFSGTLGVAAVNLSAGERVDYQSAAAFPPASTIKLPVLYEVFRGACEGRWRLDHRMTLTAANRVEGSGVLLDLKEGLQLSVWETATLMIVVSDNTATNMLIDLCGIEAVNRSMLELGLSGIQLNRKIGMMMDKPLGSATPADMAALMQQIAEKRVLDPRACTDMLDIMSRQKYKEFTDRYIPETDSEEGNPTVRIASKGGWVRGVRNDVAVVWAPRASYVLSMFSKDCRDRRYWPDNEGALTLARVSQAVYEAWGK